VKRGRAIESYMKRRANGSRC